MTLSWTYQFLMVIFGKLFIIYSLFCNVKSNFNTINISTLHRNDTCVDRKTLHSISCILFSLLSFQPIMKQCSQRAKAIFAFSLFAIVAKTNPQVTSKYRNYDIVRVSQYRIKVIKLTYENLHFRQRRTTMILFPFLMLF